MLMFYGERIRELERRVKELEEKEKETKYTIGKEVYFSYGNNILKGKIVSPVRGYKGLSIIGQDYSIPSLEYVDIKANGLIRRVYEVNIKNIIL